MIHYLLPPPPPPTRDFWKKEKLSKRKDIYFFLKKGSNTLIFFNLRNLRGGGFWTLFWTQRTSGREDSKRSIYAHNNDIIIINPRARLDSDKKWFSNTKTFFLRKSKGRGFWTSSCTRRNHSTLDSKKSFKAWIVTWPKCLVWFD